MNEEHNENLRDLAVMFAMNAVASTHKPDALSNEGVQQQIIDNAFALADLYMQGRLPTTGIVSIKRRKKE